VLSWEETLLKAHLHEGVQDFNGGKFVTPLTLGMAGGGLVPEGECCALHAQPGWELEPLP